MKKISLYAMKRRGRKVALLTAGAVILSFGMTFTSVPTLSYATTKEEAQQKKDEAEQGKQEAEEKAAQYKEEMNVLVDEVETLDSQVTDLSGQIIEKQDEADALEVEIDETQKKLAEATVNENNQYEAMKKRIQYLYEEGDVEYIDALMSSASFEDSLNKSEYVDQINSYDQKQLDKLVATRSDIQDYNDKLEKDLAEVETIKADLETQKASLDDLISQKNAKISEYTSDIATEQAKADAYQALKDEADAELAKIAQEEAAKLAAQQAAAAQKSASASTNNSSTTTTTTTTTSSGSSGFIWPVSTGGTITSEYGYRTSPTAGASSNHKGIDIGCGYGDAIVAAAAGTVTFAGYGGSGGNYVMIDHGNGITTMYLHNSSLAVSAGQTVSQGQTIAYAGSTGISTGTHCHFSVLVNGNYANPHNYL
jgi:murein DD-endopeptidase MepM/ murein hydrolase activator NlpD